MEIFRIIFWFHWLYIIVYLHPKGSFWSEMCNWRYVKEKFNKKIADVVKQVVMQSFMSKRFNKLRHHWLLTWDFACIRQLEVKSLLKCFLTLIWASVIDEGYGYQEKRGGMQFWKNVMKTVKSLYLRIYFAVRDHLL